MTTDDATSAAVKQVRPKPARHAITASEDGQGTRRSKARSANFKAVMGLVQTLPSQDEAAPKRKRQLVAELCKLLGDHLSESPGPGTELRLAPRLRQTLERLVRGDSEKQVAAHLGLSPHTVHVYVKQLYKRLNVSSRGELLARFVRGAR